MVERTLKIAEPVNITTIAVLLHHDASSMNLLSVAYPYNMPNAPIQAAMSTIISLTYLFIIFSPVGLSVLVVKEVD